MRDKRNCMKAAVLLAAVVASTAPALATGGFGCGTAEGGKVSFDLSALTTRGMGFPVLSFDGRMDIRDESIAADLRKTVFETRHLAQYWSEDGELKLLIYREREGDLPFGSVQLIVRTRWSEEGDLTGRYALQVVDMTGDTTGTGKELVLEGDVSCMIE